MDFGAENEKENAKRCTIWNRQEGAMDVHGLNLLCNVL
jgi:hypothetical protein